ncbi:uncharacterized protein [Temnothorax nylanderi]|uniref:uncharacterized protein isoform X2 n=1 Tax=Temnothorax nylanderi TaxID=102681 RepID=UPI003A8453C3
MCDNNKERYVIVRFMDDNSNSSKLLDLVPLSWVHGDEENGYTCLYPGSCDYEHMDSWLLSLKEPEQHWESFTIEVIAYAKDLKQGKRRLKRAFKSDEIKCTDDGCDDEGQPIKMSTDALEERLNAVKPLKHWSKPSSASVNSASVNQPKTKNNSGICSTDEPTEHTVKIIDVPVLEPISGNVFVQKEYIDHKFEQLQEEILSKIKSAKRSILYDLDKKINEIKHTIVLNSPTGNTAQGGVEKIKSDLEIILPPVTLEDFLQLENLLINSESKRESLMSLFRILIAGDVVVKDSIAKTLESVMVKAVELQYSGTGKVIKGHGKRNFSATNTYLCLRGKINIF